MVKGVLFDFWGTLIEQGTFSPLRQSYKLLNPRLPYSEYVDKFEGVLMTKHYDDQRTAFIATCTALGIEPKDTLISRLISIWNKNLQLAKLYPETIEVLEKLRQMGIKIGLVSNSPAFSAEVALSKFGMTKFFDVVALSCCEGVLKQTGELMTIALQKLALKPKEVLMIGDAIETDMEGAARAGIRGILVDRKGTRGRKWERTIKNLKEIFDALEGNVKV